jgi:hypothetical protein
MQFRECVAGSQSKRGVVSKALSHRSATPRDATSVRNEALISTPANKMDCQVCLDLQSAWERADAAHFKTVEALHANVNIGSSEMQALRDVERIAKLAVVRAEFALIHHRRIAHGPVHGSDG